MVPHSALFLLSLKQRLRVRTPHLCQSAHDTRRNETEQSMPAHLIARLFWAVNWLNDNETLERSTHLLVAKS